MDMLTEPATCVEVVELENVALFVGLQTSPHFARMNLGQWGGWSNCLYHSHHNEDRVPYRLGDHDVFVGRTPIKSLF